MFERPRRLLPSALLVAMVAAPAAANLLRSSRPWSKARAHTSLGARSAARGGSHADTHKLLSAWELSSCVVADLCPHGMLPLAWAASAGGGTGGAVAVLLMTLFGGLAAYTLYLCSLIAECDDSAAHKPPALSTVWSSAGLPLPTFVDSLVAVLCAGCCIFYAAFAADLFHALVKHIVTRRYLVLTAITLMPLAPLCLGDDLSLLKYSSYAGLLGVFYTSGFLLTAGLNKPQPPPTKKSWSQGLSAVSLSPPSPWRFTQGSAVLANTLVVAYLCHYNALQYSRELRDTSPTKYGAVVSVSIMITAAVFACTLIGGRLAFGTDAKPNVLNNLDSSTGSILARLGTGIAILSGFPLMFAGLKAALEGALPNLKDRQRGTLHAACLSLIGLVAAIATEDDVGLLVELLGSTLGCVAVYIVPGLSAARFHVLPTIHRRFGAILAALGTILACGSTYLTLSHHE